jgi:hypothetical protein
MLAFRRLEASGLKVVQACQFRGSKSRNKVSVGEPAEGSNFVFADKNVHSFVYLRPKMRTRPTSSGWCLSVCSSSSSVQAASSDVGSALAPTNAARIAY